MNGIEPLLEIMAKLRDSEQGCPWDLEQSFESVAPYTLEEAYEVDHAIRQGDMEGLREELGDLLFQVVFHARMAEEDGLFAFQDVVEEICDKLVRRHPHIFPAAGREPTDEPRITSSEEQTRAWEEYKAAERAQKAAAGGSDDPFEGIPLALPALSRAVALRKRAARAGLASAPGDAGEGARARQLLEELLPRALDEAPPSSFSPSSFPLSGGERGEGEKGERESLRGRVGELLSACAILARRLGVDPEEALREANAQDEERWRAAHGERVSAASTEGTPGKGRRRG
jgi:ATP diphosphatase